MKSFISRQQRRAAIASAQKHALTEQRRRDAAARKLALLTKKSPLPNTDGKSPSIFEIFCRTFGGPLVRLYYDCKRL
jgi:hypothetical protein